MTEFPKDIIFKYGWRKYQQRVLEELRKHLGDRHLHIIAPPGSGKTVLGLEVAIQLNKPTLILAPTLAIRNQWVQRFCELFLQTNLTPDWISRDIRNPKFMTVVTYQGLHAACNNLISEEENTENEEENPENETAYSKNPNLDHIVNGLKSQKIKTIVLDEAHHLKKEWWETLTKVKEKLDPTIVGLTATPPFDVTPKEWQRYIELNGPVDAEISVPELIIEGDLCPHQDYIYFSSPTEQEYFNIVGFRQNFDKVFQEVSKDEILIKAIEQHPMWENPEGNIDFIYNNLSYYSACLIFLKSNNKEISKTHLEVIGNQKLEIPKLDYKWLEILLDFYLYKCKDHFKAFEEQRNKLENRLKRSGVIERKQIMFLQNKRVTGLLTSSISKLNSIKEIVDFEYNQLNKDLRLVILSDFIRREFFTNAPENNLELNKIGIIPIFEKLRRENKVNIKIAVLTGSIVILPRKAFAAFEAKAAEYGITEISFTPVPYDDNYILIKSNDQIKHDIVHLVTQIFQEGEIEVLIGTKSLLGEGWDAPAINALILASFIGSFVLSNQMRGRAIRTQKGNSNKVGNIWHLACIDPTSPTGGEDYELLKRRFRCFVGVSFDEQPVIENGIGRLNLPENIFLKRETDLANTKMLAFADNREHLKERWAEALTKGLKLVEEIKIPFRNENEYQKKKSLYLQKTIKNLFITLGWGVITFLWESFKLFLKLAKEPKKLPDPYVFLTFLGIFGVILFGRQTYKTFSLYIKYRDIAKDIEQIGVALLYSLIDAKIINTKMSNYRIETTLDNQGAVYCHLEGGTTFDKSTFMNALQEITGMIDNPRYVLVRKNRFLFSIC